MKPDVELDGTAPIERLLHGMGERAKNPRRSLAHIADDFRLQMRQEFSTQGAAGGRRWRKLDADTVERKSAESLSPMILQASGELMRSLTGGPGHIDEQTPHGITLGTTVDYAVFHIYGARQTPKREIKVRASVIRGWVDDISDEIMGGRE